MTLNFDPHVAINKVAVVLYCLALIPSYAVVFFCTYEAVENKWMRYRGIVYHSQAPPRSSMHDATTDTDHKEHDANRVGYLRSSSSHVRVRYILHRWGWVLVSAVVAASIPRFGDYLGLIGALANSMAIYVMPQVCVPCPLAPLARLAPAPSGRRQNSTSVWQVGLLFVWKGR